MTINEDQVLKYGDLEVAVAKITPAGIAYLLQYGFAKSLQDSIAGRKKALMAGTPNEDPTKAVAPLTESEAEAKVAEIMNARFAAIIDGEVGVRTGGGPAMSKLERTMRNVAAEILRAAASAKGVKLPKGEAYQTLVSSYIAKNEDAVRTEAERRMETTTETDVDLTDLGL